MLSCRNEKSFGNSDDNDRKLEELSMKVRKCERLIWDKKIPVIILFLGEDDNKSKDNKAINKCVKTLISCFEPLTYDVVCDLPTESSEVIFLRKYWLKIPCKGKVTMLECNCYGDLLEKYKSNAISELSLKDNLNRINIVERQLADDGYVIIKIAFDNKNEKAEEIIKDTSTEYAPWHYVECADKECCKVEIMKIFVNSVNSETDSFPEKTGGCITAQPDNFSFEYVSCHKLDELPTLRYIHSYKQQLAHEQERFFYLQRKMHKEKVSLVVALEGWDASGKSGTIKRIIGALAPDMFKVIPIGAPDNESLSRHYLWRFYKNLPAKGKVAVFDRTWYGRVLVERVEKLTPVSRWTDAYREINEFERFMQDSDIILVKIWMNISKNEQLARFHIRQTDPEKSWKIKADDWRNREQWDNYHKAVDEMTAKTSTEYAPWHIIGADDKQYARVKALKIINRTIEKYFDSKNNDI